MLRLTNIKLRPIKFTTPTFIVASNYQPNYRKMQRQVVTTGKLSASYKQRQDRARQMIDHLVLNFETPSDDSSTEFKIIKIITISMDKCFQQLVENQNKAFVPQILSFFSKKITDIIQGWLKHNNTTPDQLHLFLNRICMCFKKSSMHGASMEKFGYFQAVRASVLEQFSSYKEYLIQNATEVAQQMKAYEQLKQSIERQNDQILQKNNQLLKQYQKSQSSDTLTSNSPDPATSTSQTTTDSSKNVAIQTSEQTAASNSQQKRSPTEPPCLTPLIPLPPRPNIPTTTLSNLLTNILSLPEQLKGSLYDCLLFKQNRLGDSFLGIVMGNNVLSPYPFSREYLKKFHDLVGKRHISLCFRYYFLCFVQCYMQTYLPLYNSNNMGKNYVFLQEMERKYDNLLMVIRFFQKQYDLGRRTSSRQALKENNLSILIIEQIIYQRKLAPLQIMKLYNTMSAQYPMGVLFLRYIDSLPFEIQKKKDQQLVKKFLISFQKYLQPQYIFSVQERSASQLTQRILNYCLKISQEIVKIQPEFILKLGRLLQNCFYSLNYQSQESAWDNGKYILYDLGNNLTHVIADIDNLVSKGYDRQWIHKNIVDIINENQYYLNGHVFDQFIQKEVDTLLANPLPEPLTPQNYRYIFQLCRLLRNDIQTKKIQQFISMYHVKLLRKQLEEHRYQEQKSILPCIKAPRPEYEHVLSLFSLCSQQYFRNPNNAETVQLLINFINQVFIYHAKSVVKYGVFNILDLFNKLEFSTLTPADNDVENMSEDSDVEIRINAQIYAYLWTNVSTFIVHMKKYGTFLLRIGRASQLKFQYIKVLNMVARNYNHFKNLKNKDRLNIIQCLLNEFWLRIPERQIAKLLIIIGSPTLLYPQIKRKLQKAIFNESNIKGLDYQILSRFTLQNVSLDLALFKLTDKNQQLIGQSNDTPNKFNQKKNIPVLNNQMTEEELREIFKIQEFYWLAMQNPDFTNEHLIPPPSPQHQYKTKMIYVCLKAIGKIRQHSSFEVSQLVQKIQKDLASKQQKMMMSSQQSGSVAEQEKIMKRKHSSHIEIDLSKQFEYITQNDLIRVDSLNQFKLDNIEATGHYEAVEGWYHYISNPLFMAQLYEYKIFIDSEDNQYQKLLIALKGNYGLVRGLVRSQQQNKYISSKTQDYNIQILSVGSLHQFKSNNDILYMLSVKPSNYKKHLIFAYLLSQLSSYVCIVNYDTPFAQFQAPLELLFKDKKIRKQLIEEEIGEMLAAQEDSQVEKIEQETKIN